MWYHENQTCLGQNQELNGLNLLDYIKNVSLISPTSKKVNFDEHGGVKAKYKIYNYQVVFSCQNCSKSFNIVNVGYWGGNVPQHHLKFGLTKLGDIMYQLKSQCQICRVDFTKRKVMFSCYGTCDPCLGQNYTNTTSSKECQICPQYMWVITLLAV